jgi:cell division protease FtsH
MKLLFFLLTGIYGLKFNKYINKQKMRLHNYEYDLLNINKYKNLMDKLDYTKLTNLINTNKLDKIYIDNINNDIYSIDKYYDTSFQNYHLTHISYNLQETLINKITDHSIPLYFIDLTKKNELLYILNSSFNYIIPLLIVIGFFRVISKINNQMNIQGSFIKESNFIKPNISLNDWAGSAEIIEECKDIIYYIENKNKYQEMNALMPKGFLLNGPPGTGKTLLAKAIASTTNNTFISISGSEFMELYVGLGASRIRELFSNARKNKPCIIFIDEIDAIGKKRGNNLNGMNDEREQTLNQLLYEMDGFNNNDDIFIIGATNRKDILDDALLRPGRFDRIITVPLPDKFSRKQIIKLYLKNKKYDSNIDLDSFADITNGFSGAQLNNIINEATILSIKYNKYIITEEYLFEAFEKSIVGLIKKNSTTNSAILERVALHEVGHTIMVLLNEHMTFQKVSILPTYNGAGGYTLFTNKDNEMLFTKNELKNKIMVMLGGKAMEELFYGEDNVSLGCIKDLEEAKLLTSNMITKYGMGQNLKLYFEQYTQEESEKLKEDKYNEVLNLLNESYNNTKILLKKNFNVSIALATQLQERKTLYKKDINIDLLN